MSKLFEKNPEIILTDCFNLFRHQYQSLDFIVRSFIDLLSTNEILEEIIGSDMIKRGSIMREEARKLIGMVKKGVPDREIMEKLGIQTKASLRKMYYDALVEAGKIKDIITEREAGGRKTLKITNRGTLLLSKALVVDKLGFKGGDKFSVSKRKDSIILRKIDKE